MTKIFMMQTHEVKEENKLEKATKSEYVNLKLYKKKKKKKKKIQ